MSDQSSFWLYPLILFGAFAFLQQVRSGLFWTWGFALQAAILFIIGVCGLVVGPGTIFAILGWLMFALFYVVPRIIISRMRNSFGELDGAGALMWANILRFLFWGKPGRFTYETAQVVNLYLNGNTDAADALIAEWKLQLLPKAFAGYPDSYYIYGRTILRQWQQIADWFESDDSALARNIPVSLSSVARAYAELGRFEEAWQCLEKANQQLSRMGRKALAVSLVSFFSLIGSIEYLEKIISMLGERDFPKYMRNYWRGRCLAARADNLQAAASFEQAEKDVSVSLNKRSNLRIWQERIQYALSQLGKSQSGSQQWTNEANRDWNIFQRNVFVQDIVAPSNLSKSTIVLVAIIVLCYFVCDVYRYFPNAETAQWELNMLKTFCLDPKLATSGEYWRFLTHLFLHANPTHLLFNVLALLWFGRVAENIYGTARYLLVFFVSGVLSGIAQAYLSTQLALGASGAVMGVFGAVLVGFFRLKNDLPSRERKVEMLALAAMMVAQLILDQIIPNIAIFSHLGGFLAGICVASFLKVKRPLVVELKG